MIGVAAYVSVCALFSVQGGMLDSENNAHTDTYMVCCHTSHNNGILIILIRDFS
jgi:hypothetical protein